MSVSTPQRLASLYRRAGVVAFLLAALATLVVVCLAAWAVRAAHEVPTLNGDGGPLAEALQWPWSDFPAVTAVERETIRRQFRLDEPLFAERVLLWTRVPQAGPLRPGRGTRRDLEAVLPELRRLADPRRPVAGDADPYAFESDGGAARLAAASTALNGVEGGEGSWVVAYDRGVVNLWRGAVRQAQRDLESARDLLLPLFAAPASDAVLAEIYSAAAHTEYALGHALRAGGGGGEPESMAERRRADAIGAFRLATQFAVAVIKRTGGVYPEVSHELSLFRFHETGLSTGELTNDLVAAYLADAGYHDCPERPQGLPCDPMPSPRAVCAYRDRSFCKSLARASRPFGQPFADLMQRFYAGEAWGEEHRLWALSNAVDRRAENLDLGDPYLLYNFATLLIESGRFAAAADYLDRVQAAVDDSVPDADLERMTRLATVGRVLAGRSPLGGREQPRVSSLRQRYRAFYGERTDLPVTEFAPVGAAFEPNAESLIDRWLFLQLWRAQLARGDLAGFEREYRRLASKDGVPGDFFARWRREVLTALGERALDRAAAYEADGERDQAWRIRFFLSESGQFPPRVERRARTLRGWAVWVLRRAATPLAVGLGLLVVALIWAYTLGVVRTYRSLFVSAHRRDRLDGAAGG